MKPEEHFQLEYWLEILNRRRRILLGIVIISVIIGAVVSFLSPPLYRAQTSIYFPAHARPMLPAEMPSGSGENQMDINLLFLGQMIQPSMQDYAVAILKSQTVSDAVLDKYGEGIFPGRFKRRKRVQLREMMGRYIKIMMAADNVIHISVETPKPELSKEIADFYTQKFREISRDAVLTTAKNKRIHLEKQGKFLKEKLQKYEEEMASFERNRGVVDLEAETKSAVDNYGKLTIMAATAKAQEDKARIKLDALRESLRRQAETFEEKGSLPDIQDQPYIQELMKDLSEKELQLIQARQSYTDLHPKVKKLQGEVDDIKALLRKEIQGYLADVKSDLVPRLIDAQTEMMAAQAQTEALETLVKNKHLSMGKFPDLKLAYNRKKRKVETGQLVMNLVDKELEKARIEEAREDAQMQILDAAIVPDYKAKPEALYNMILAAIFGLILGTMACFYVEYANRVIRNVGT